MKSIMVTATLKNNNSSCVTRGTATVFRIVFVWSVSSFYLCTAAKLPHHSPRCSWTARTSYLTSTTLTAATPNTDSLTRLKLATSSRDLQEKNRGSRKSSTTNSNQIQSNQIQSNHNKDDENSVVQRLSKAIAQARASKTAASSNRQANPSPTTVSNKATTNLASLRQLTKEIDHQLTAGRGPRRNQLIGGMAGGGSVVLQPRDSMSALLEHNDKMNAKTALSGSSSGTVWPSRQVAVVFSKPLVDNQVTLEYASRLRAVAKAIQHDLYRPTLLCFTGGISAPNVVADADAGFLFFRHLCAAQHISLEGIDFVLDRTSSSSSSTSAAAAAAAGSNSDYQSKDEGKALAHIVQQIQQHWLSRWLDEEFTPSSVTEEDTSILSSVPQLTEVDSSSQEVLLKRPPSTRPKKLLIHFTLISTEYHLCNLNDIHHRSPRQSLLRPLASAQSEEHRHAASGSKIQVEIMWSYQYSTYPSIYFAKDEAKAFMGKCYRLGEELVPLLVNMKGVVDSMEFFQRDNYLVLVAVRRALVKDLEALYGTSPAKTMASLKQSLKTVVPRHSSSAFGSASAAPLEVVLENAVLSLGRCLDLVRPAGQLKGSVSKQDWNKAVKALEHAMKQIRQACDPDSPLDPMEWGRYSGEIDHQAADQNVDLGSDYLLLDDDDDDQDRLFEKSSDYDAVQIELADDDDDLFTEKLIINPTE